MQFGQGRVITAVVKRTLERINRLICQLSCILPFRSIIHAGWRPYYT